LKRRGKERGGPGRLGTDETWQELLGTAPGRSTNCLFAQRGGKKARRGERGRHMGLGVTKNEDY